MKNIFIKANIILFLINNFIMHKLFCIFRKFYNLGEFKYYRYTFLLLIIHTNKFQLIYMYHNNDFYKINKHKSNIFL